MIATRSISNDQDVIDSRDIIARIEDLQSDRQALVDEVEDAETDEDRATAQSALDTWDIEEDAAELKTLLALAEEGEQNAEDWIHGAGLIRASYFKEYAEQYADDIGAIKRDMGWPYDHIDWDAAADALKVDYCEVEFDGVSYLVR